ncbi:MAG TPA: membrane protein insertase YidC [Sedimentisphaerales bacterium]|nr:membrane protein insertase YidC [Sedimentisphaerales bacterium]
MSVKRILIVILAGFCLLCGGLIVQSGFPRLILLQQTTDVATPPAAAQPAQPAQPQLQADSGESFGAVGGPKVDVTIGSTDKASAFKYQLVLDSQGAAIRTATSSEYDNRDCENLQPLKYLTPIDPDGSAVFSLATRDLVLLDEGRSLKLDRLSWQSLGIEELQDGGAATSFVATIVDGNDQPVLKLTKTYRVHPDNYMLDGAIQIENLSGKETRVQYGLNGPIGLPADTGTRQTMDMRKVVAAFKTPGGQIQNTGLKMKDLSEAATLKDRELTLDRTDVTFLWAATVSKYFAGILVPTTADGQPGGDWIAGKWGVYFNPDQDAKHNTGDESLGFIVQSVPVALEPNASQTHSFQLYLGPKDKGRFDKVPLYRSLGFVHTIDFMSCCCPASIINPLAFGILAIMNWMYYVIPNYGIVIIILVFIMRLVLHPVTKKSQIAMHKMSKLAPRAEEIKQKYGSNKAEMNKKLMELYREQGASPIMGFLPMFVQMPIWIALWSAIYTSIDLRGAAFLPFWITDLSAPDALIPLGNLKVPLLGWPIGSLNLLPLLMGVAFYLQQKLTPMQQASAATNPQLAQQQKMMNIMMPLMFPLMLYTAPSGVNLYIMSSTFAGVIEQYVIKKHIREREEMVSQGLIPTTSKMGGKIKKKKPKPFYRFK